MARPREPIEVLVAKGKKHLTKAEIEERQNSQVKTKKPARIKTPNWLPAEHRKAFRAYAKQLIDLDIYSELDAETLGRYLVAQGLWIQAGEYAARAISEADAAAAGNWGILQDRYYKQATTSARELGLTISSRCRLVIPQNADGEEEPDDLFG